MRPLIVGNWKMHGTAQQLGEIAAVAVLAKATPPCTGILICLSAKVRAILALPEVGGVLVGGARLKAADFDGIFRAVAHPEAASSPADCVSSRLRHREAR